MEYADEGDLFQKITLYQKLKTSFDEADIWRIFIQITKGLNDLHEYKILHRDLKSANVFLFRNGSAKLGDLNVSKITYRGLGCTQTGTPYYASPEVWKDNPYDLKSDIWSLGCITYEMAMLKTPFRSNTMEGLFQKIIKGDYPRLIKKYSEDLNYVISTMIRVHSKERPTTGEILEMEEVQKKNEEYDIFKKFGYNNEENKNNNNIKELKRELKAEEEKEDIKVVIDTIKIPNKFILLNSNLPKARYDNNNKDIKNNINKESKNAISSNKKLEELPKLDIKNRIAYKNKENLKKFKMKIKDSNNGGKNEMKKIRLKNKKLDSSLYRSIDMKLIQE